MEDSYYSWTEVLNSPSLQSRSANSSGYTILYYSIPFYSILFFLFYSSLFYSIKLLLFSFVHSNIMSEKLMHVFVLILVCWLQVILQELLLQSTDSP